MKFKKFIFKKKKMPFNFFLYKNILMNENSSTYDLYNYHSLNRKDLMQLSKISPTDEKFNNLKGLTTNREYSQNLINIDIEGFKNILKFRKFSKKIWNSAQQNRLYK